MPGKFRRFRDKLWAARLLVLTLIPIGGAIHDSNHRWQVGFACLASLALGGKLSDWANSDDKDEEGGEEGEDEEEDEKPDGGAGAAAGATR